MHGPADPKRAFGNIFPTNWTNVMKLMERVSSHLHAPTAAYEVLAAVSQDLDTLRNLNDAKRLKLDNQLAAVTARMMLSHLGVAKTLVHSPNPKPSRPS